jgi:glycosyltransferase involved in cell wall biosynthesis
MIYPTVGHRPTRRRRTENGHPAHRGFAAAIGADDLVLSERSLPAALRGTLLRDLVPAVGSPLPERDVYVLENDAVLYAAPAIARRHPEATIVHLAAADRLLDWTFVPRPDDTRLRAATRRTNARLDTALLQRACRRHCDGAVAVSRFAHDRLRDAVGPGFPIGVAPPYVQPDLYESLPTREPALDAPVAVMVGAWRDHKGTELLVEAWPRVRERHPEAELHVVGPGHPAEYAETVGVRLRGYVRSLADVFAGAALYVHPAHVEAFGVSVVEAMRAGLPAVVTETTGARAAVERVDEGLVVPPTSAAIAEAVSTYFDAPPDRRRALSRASRTASDPYSEERATGRFREAFERVAFD